MTMRPGPEPVDTHKPQDVNDQHSLSRWIGKISVWCVTRTASSPIEWNNVRRPMGPQRAAELNALPGRILQDFRDLERRDPTDAEIFERYVERLAHLGHHWNADTESVRTSDPLETAKLLATSIERKDPTLRGPTSISTNMNQTTGTPATASRSTMRTGTTSSPGSGRPLPRTTPGSFPSGPSGTPRLARRSQEMTGDRPEGPDEAGGRRTAGRSGSRRSAPALVHIGTVGERITVSGTVVTTGWVQSYRWEPRTLLIVDCGTAHVKMITSARWAHKVRRGERLTLIGTVKAHTEDLGAPLTVLTRPRLIEQPAEPQTPTPGPTGEVWEALNPAPAKRGPFPGRPTHWPRRRNTRTRSRNRTTGEESSHD